jgi:hypothetical protein
LIDIMKTVTQSVRPILLGLFLVLAACKDFPGADGRYATPARGGWDNFRGEAPASASHEMQALSTTDPPYRQLTRSIEPVGRP